MKKGFSLSELIIVFGIIGIMVTLGLKSFSNNDNQIKYLYSSLYHSLDRALYNTMLYWVPEDDYQRQPFKTSVSNNSTVTSVSDAQGAERLCKALVEYINTIDEACSASNAVDDSGEDSLFTPEKVQFEAFNGMRFWISKRYPETTSSSIADTNMKFFIVYADVNGVKPPNSLRYQQNYVDANSSASTNNSVKDMRDPDIFAFAAMEDGRVVPIGIAEFEPRFLTTRLTYSYWNE